MKPSPKLQRLHQCAAEQRATVKARHSDNLVLYRYHQLRWLSSGVVDNSSCALFFQYFFLLLYARD